MQKWEYKVVSKWSMITEENLNQLGEEGWELVQQIALRNIFIFKRPKISN